MTVLIIPENPTKDQYILKPLIEQMLSAMGKARANVFVCQDPAFDGVDEATDWANLQELVEQYRSNTRVFLLLVDRDGNPGRREALDRIETKAAEVVGSDRIFLAENAHQEIEAWMLAGLDLPREWRWGEIRDAVDVKERFFEPLAKERNVEDGPGGGRKALGAEAARNYQRVRGICDEIRTLEDRLRTALGL